MCIFIHQHPYIMKLFSAIFLILLSTNCGNSNLPSTMPDDFKIEYHFDGGMVNEHRNITLQVGASTDKGRSDDAIINNGPMDYEYQLDVKKEDLENLYIELKRLGIFTMKHRTEKDVHDRGGESQIGRASCRERV